MPDMLVLHSGEGSKASDLKELTDNQRPLNKRVSAHYYVDRQGTIYELIDPATRAAWHAGTSAWAGRGSAEIRDLSVGIETEHKQGQDWPQAQRSSLTALCRYLIERFNIPRSMVVAHRWIAPSRKLDPTNWPNAELKPWIAMLYAPMARLWVVRAEIGANIRRQPSVAAEKVGALPYGALFHGDTVAGADVDGNPIWIARLPSEGAGYIWAGACQEVK